MKTILTLGLAICISFSLSAQKTNGSQATVQKNTIVKTTSASNTSTTSTTGKTEAAQVNRTTPKKETTTTQYRSRSSKEIDQNSSSATAIETNSGTTENTTGNVVLVNSNEEPQKFPPSDNSKPLDLFGTCEGKVLITPSMFSIYSLTQIKRMLQSGEYCLAPTVLFDLRCQLMGPLFWL